MNQVCPSRLIQHIPLFDDAKSGPLKKAVAEIPEDIHHVKVLGMEI